MNERHVHIEISAFVMRTFVLMKEISARLSALSFCRGMTVQHIFQRRHRAGWTARDADILFLCLFVRVMQHLVRHRARKQNQQIRISKILQSFFCLREDLRAAIVGLAQILVPPDHTFIPTDNHYTHNLFSFVSFFMLAFVLSDTPSLLFLLLFFVIFRFSS